MATLRALAVVAQPERMKLVVPEHHHAKV
jgi:hypothetical protein